MIQYLSSDNGDQYVEAIEVSPIVRAGPGHITSFNRDLIDQSVNDFEASQITQGKII